jgi:hypothetical protein
MEKITWLEKLSVISKLAERYVPFDNNVLSAIDLACSLIETMDELKFFNVSIDDLCHEYTSEHLEKRALFFNIVTQHWPKILEELNLSDCENNYVFREIENMEAAYAKAPTIFSTGNILEEAECVFDIVRDNVNGDEICIVADDKRFALMLAEKFKIAGICYKSYLENDEIRMEEIIEKFECESVSQARKIIQIINTRQSCSKRDGKISITNNRNINPNNNKGIVILSCVTSRQYGTHMASFYWLQDQVRTKLGLPTSKQYRKIVENNFCKLLNSAKVFITFSKKLDGSLSNTHNVLRKFLFKQQDCAINTYKKKCKNTKIEKQPIVAKKSPKEMSTYEMGLLLNDQYSFYIVNSLRVYPETYSLKDKKNEILNALCKKFTKEIMRNNNEEAEKILQSIADCDFYKYQQCRNIAKWLFLKINKDNVFTEALIDVCGEACWRLSNSLGNGLDNSLGNDQEILLKGRIDALFSNTLIVSRVFRRKISATNVIDGTYSMPLALCLLAKLAAFDNRQINVSEIQIWDMDGMWPEPVKVNSIQISPETVDYFENKLKSSLSNYVTNPPNLETNNSEFFHYKRQ